jgi:hypothetical protein
VLSLRFRRCQGTVEIEEEGQTIPGRFHAVGRPHRLVEPRVRILEWVRPCWIHSLVQRSEADPRLLDDRPAEPPEGDAGLGDCADLCRRRRLWPGK